MKILCLMAAGLCLLGPAFAQETPQAFTGARIIPVSGPEIPNGTLVVQNGKITAIGPAASTALPANAQRHDVSGKVLLPGLVDTHSHIGGGSGGDGSAALHPDVRIMDSLDARDNSLKRALAGGITTVNIMPGSGHVLSGQTLYLKLRGATTIDGLLIRDAQGRTAGGIKMANGTNSIKQAPFPGTRAKSAAMVRELFLKAVDYREKVRRAAGDREKMPPRDLGMEALGELLNGERIVHFHTHRHDDILTVLRHAKEFGFRVVLQHVTEGWRVAEEIARSPQVVGSSIIVLDSPGGKIEAVNLSWRTGAVLEQAGAPVAFHTDDSVTDSRLLLRSAGLAVRAGMSREKALDALTLAPAKMLDLAGRVGSLDPGKDADFVVLSGDPLSVYTKVLETWVEGEKVFDRSRAEDKLYAVGGWGAGQGRSADLDCYAEVQ